MCVVQATGTVKNGIKSPWVTGAVFVTPPGWWHSHHNESAEVAWVLPMQDAGLYTYQVRILFPKSQHCLPIHD